MAEKFYNPSHEKGQKKVGLSATTVIEKLDCEPKQIQCRSPFTKSYLDSKKAEEERNMKIGNTAANCAKMKSTGRPVKISKGSKPQNCQAAYSPLKETSLTGGYNNSNVCTCNVAPHEPAEDTAFQKSDASSSPPHLWTHYDAYHGANFTVEIPSSVINTSSSENNLQTQYYTTSEDSEDEDHHQHSDRVPLQLWNNTHGNGQESPIATGVVNQRNCYNALAKLIGPSLHPGWKLNYQDFAPDFTGYDDGNITCKETFR